jgi:transposase
MRARSSCSLPPLPPGHAGRALGREGGPVERRRRGEREIGERAQFARQIRDDADAVHAGPTLRHGNGQTEGQVGRLKLVTRKGYGRAKVDLLRKRVLRAA